MGPFDAPAPATADAKNRYAVKTIAIGKIATEGEENDTLQRR